MKGNFLSNIEIFASKKKRKKCWKRWDQIQIFNGTCQCRATKKNSKNLYCVTMQFSQCTEVYFTSFFSGRFVTTIVVNPPERKLAKCTSVQWSEIRNMSMWSNKKIVKICTVSLCNFHSDLKLTISTRNCMDKNYKEMAKYSLIHIK